MKFLSSYLSQSKHKYDILELFHARSDYWKYKCEGNIISIFDNVDALLYVLLCV